MNKRLLNCLFLAGICLLSFLSISCMSTRDRVFRGHIIDADTKEPIEGAVIVAIWREYQAFFLGGKASRVKDVKETLSNRDGEWSMIGPAGQETPCCLSPLFAVPELWPPEFIIFKPGYCPWPKGIYISSCEEKIRPGSKSIMMGGASVELPKIKNYEDRRKALPYPIYDKEETRDIFLKKQREFIKLINKESRNLGLKEHKYKFLEEK